MSELLNNAVTIFPSQPAGIARLERGLRRTNEGG